MNYLLVIAGVTILLATPCTALADAAVAPGPNPLLAPWVGPYGGVPPFDELSVEHFRPALEAGMAAKLAEIDRIAANPAAPTFDNTIAALERSGRMLRRVESVYDIYNSSLQDTAMQAVKREMAPKLAGFRDQITQNSRLFERIAAVYAAREKSGLTAEQQRLAWLYYTNFVRAGAQLEGDARLQLSAINQQLASLFTQFGQNVLQDESEGLLLIEDEAGLAGIPAAARDSMAGVAEARGHAGKWAVANTRSSIEPFLTYSQDRELRRRAWQMFVDRGDQGGATDNNAIITQILRLRAQRAKLLGYPTHAHWRLEDTMAKTPAAAMAFMEAVWAPAVARARQEVADMQALADQESPGLKIEPWDYRFYADKVRKAKYDLDQNEVMPYLQLENLRESMFYMARELLGLTFTPVGTDVPVFHPDVRVWEVSDEQGHLVGLWYFDPYARKGKNSGAWMSVYRTQERFDDDIKPIVSNNLNLLRGKPGEPVLVSWDDATTLFHEFGHGLHGLSSNVNYPSLAGTAVARDYVEFPSQILEHWLSTPELLNRFALHYRTGKPMPAELLAKIEAAGRFDQGFKTVEYLAGALVDMKLHLAGEMPIDADKFERETLAALAMPAEIVMRHRTPHFNHVFASNSYSAGYYSYLWADMITADAWEGFAEGDGPWDRQLARKLIENVFSVGNTLDPAESYRAFRGRDPDIGPLMRKRGFPVPAR
jgi:peptidyl-dipeptidase Dcp